MYGFVDKSFITGEYSIHSTANGNNYTIIPETLGQYTGLTDENGAKIFEGDIVEYEDIEEERAIVKFEQGAFGFVPIGENFFAPFCHEEFGFEPEWVEVIGNIYDKEG